MPDNASVQSFLVHVAGDVRHTRRIEGASFEDAAMTFAELWSPDAAGDLEVIVEDADSGRRCCYRIDLGSGDAEPCG